MTRVSVWLLAGLSFLSSAEVILAESIPPGAAVVACDSKVGERNHCAADTSKGVILARSEGEALGRRPRIDRPCRGSDRSVSGSAPVSVCSTRPA